MEYNPWAPPTPEASQGIDWLEVFQEMEDMAIDWMAPSVFSLLGVVSGALAVLVGMWVFPTWHPTMGVEIEVAVTATVVLSVAHAWLVLTPVLITTWCAAWRWPS